MLGHPLAAQNSTVNVKVNDGLSFAAGITTPSIGALSGAGNVNLPDHSSSHVQLAAGGNNATTISTACSAAPRRPDEDRQRRDGAGQSEQLRRPDDRQQRHAATGRARHLGHQQRRLDNPEHRGGGGDHLRRHGYVGRDGCLNNVWGDTPMAGLTTQPWTASFTYQHANNQCTDGWRFTCRPRGLQPGGRRHRVGNRQRVRPGGLRSGEP